MPLEYQLNQKTAKKVYLSLLCLGVIFLFFSALPLFQGAAEANSYSLKKVFFHGYLFSYSFFMSVVLGALFFVLIQFLTRAEWSVVVRRIAETFMKNISLMVVLFIPLIFGTHELYHWTHAEEVAADPILAAKQGYLNLPFFYVRIAVYFAVFFLIARYYYNGSVRVDATNLLKTGDEKGRKIALSLEKYAPLSLLLFAICLSLFAIDLLMTLNPHWFSTVWGIYYFSGAVLAALALITLCALLLYVLGYLKKVITVEHYHDLGKLLFAFNVFWSYIAFSQYMLIWYANVPEETLFYINRTTGSWFDVSLFLVVGHVFLPIVGFLSRNAKRNLVVQAVLCTWMVFIQLVDLYWVVMPKVYVSGLAVGAVEVFLFFGMAFLFFGFFIKNLSSQALVPYSDPRFNESLRFENA